MQGAVTHQDFSGRKGTIRTGDVQVQHLLNIPVMNMICWNLSPANTAILNLQWMTAGRGIVHSEMPASDGVQKGLQLWINLASKDKMYVVS
jgi:redox-sensitive bicupin YhaK (pirin superfamily)